MCIARGNHVVARLPAIHIVIGMRAGEVSDHLVGVHVGGRAAAGLKNIDDELVVVPPLHHLFGRASIRRHVRRQSPNAFTRAALLINPARG